MGPDALEHSGIWGCEKPHMYLHAASISVMAGHSKYFISNKITLLSRIQISEILSEIKIPEKLLFTGCSEEIPPSDLPGNTGGHLRSSTAENTLHENIWESLEHLYCRIYVGTRDNSEKFLPPPFSLLNIKHKMLLFLIMNAKYGKLILYILMLSCLLQFNLLTVLFLDSCVCTSVPLLMRVIIFHLPLKGLTNWNDSLPTVKEHVIFMSRIRTKHLFYCAKPTLNE